jgi:hypothetical protein
MKHENETGTDRANDPCPIRDPLNLFSTSRSKQAAEKPKPSPRMMFDARPA